MEVKKVGVVGCGLMGAGIAEVCARSGYSVLVLEVNQQFLDKGMASIKSSLDRAVSKGKLSEQERDATVARLRGTLNMGDFEDRDLVIEAVIENMDEKKKVFASLDKACPAHAVLASNTSCLSILEMAMATGRPEQVIGMHFFQPVPVMRMVEIVKTIVCSDETVSTAKSFGESLGKEVIFAKDTPGFLVNRLGFPMMMNAIRILDEGWTTVEELDRAWMLGTNSPMGPFTLMDFAGLDTIYSMACAMFDEFKDRAFAPPPLLKAMVVAGRLGRKSGRGFYDYSK
ncbi:MAG: 3-hydroxybutyryl-CoA dehydrogenase [Chloroflexi bacterium]|nr:MAG: 3-hydroxybutyryl-CoA dehydrogenase [Chloroflexota bacterium]RLC97361.1 MAG: 3-hydroxybutyryl-CoA dehydrogenase [Chloroflexota bacterium]